ncbi:universal stress protein [Polymorphum gilvum]|uniref:UspA domain protein n=1 Tax=Polymorphum gilvum (strain LMG 25793 / CGMCC 1.9160 / SL003B-26A1) TaxID=991905 RepID=F2J4U8_POLGS|nr:universal stress protein [Polymorphum gilvum]ADZ69040.1 UspA domain protein [Polymorphum gilvum SL003B-26A1]
MYRTILLAYDGSRQGREALDQGAELASLCRARVYLLAVVAPELGVALAEAAAPSDLPEREYQEVRHLLTEAAETLQASGLPVETRLAVGNPAEEIGRTAREVGAELIVVGHREQTALARWWRGSTGASLLAHAPCSLLVAVSKEDDAGFTFQVRHRG